MSRSYLQVVAEVLHDRIIEAITNPNSTSSQFGVALSVHPTDAQLVAYILQLLAPTRKLLSDLGKWTRITLTPTGTAIPISTNSGSPWGGDFLPCSELGCGILLLDRSVYPGPAESAASVAQRLWQAGTASGQGFGPFTILRYIYAVAHVICQLQMLSVTRPNLCDAPTARKKGERMFCTYHLFVHSTLIRFSQLVEL